MANYQNQNQKQNQNFSFDVDRLIDDNGLVLKKLISDMGENTVKDLAEKLSKDDVQSKKITINQVRKYYDNFLKIYHNKSSIEEKKIQLIMLKAQVEYSVKRLKIINFGKFFSNRIAIIVQSDDELFQKNLDAFKLHFEALVGYFPK